MFDTSGCNPPAAEWLRFSYPVRTMPISIPTSGNQCVLIDSMNALYQFPSANAIESTVPLFHDDYCSGYTTAAYLSYSEGGIFRASMACRSEMLMVSMRLRNALRRSSSLP